jgi:hypothetical protein
VPKKAPLPTADASRPIIPPGIEEVFVARQYAMDETSRLVYRPGLLGAARLHFVRTTYKLDTWRDYVLVDVFHDGEMPDELWATAMRFPRIPDVVDGPESQGTFAPIPRGLTKARSFKPFGTKLKDFLYRHEELLVYRCKSLKAYSKATEALDDFRIRLKQLVREKRDLEVEKLRKKHAAKLTKLRDKIDRAEEKLDREEAQYRKAKSDTVVTFGESILGALFGRKLRSRTNVTRASRSAKGLGRTAKERTDVKQAAEDLAEAVRGLQEIEQQFEIEIAELSDKLSLDNLDIEALPVRTRKSDIRVDELSLAWLPWVIDADGRGEPAW